MLLRQKEEHGAIAGERWAGRKVAEGCDDGMQQQPEKCGEERGCWHVVAGLVRPGVEFCFCVRLL